MHSTFLELPSFELLSVSGDDNKKFLQGQVSCDTEQLSCNQSLTGAICNLKGRVITDFRLVEFQQDCLLQVEIDMANTVKAVLDKYIVFAKADCDVVSDKFSRFGLIGNDAHHVLEQVIDGYPAHDNDVFAAENLLVIKIAGLIPRFEIWQKSQGTSTPSDTIDSIRERSSTGSESLWAIEDFKSGIAHVSADMSEQYLPEALNYDLSGVINFNKGCYTGQEIVARMFYRGKAKKRMHYGYFDGPVAPPLTISHGVGEASNTEEIIQYQIDEESGLHLLALLPTEEVATNTEFYLNNDVNKALELQPIPYAIQE